MDKKVLSKIEGILSRIRMHPEYSVCVRRRALQNMRTEADRHSSSIEAESGEHSTTREVEQFKTDSYKNLIQARDFLGVEGVTLFSLARLGYEIDPQKNKNRDFRHEAIIFGEFAGEEWTAIPQKMNELVERIRDPSLHPVLRAIDAHASLIKVHPYKDGNGRAARLLQDYCLESMGYTPAVIPVSDRCLYISLMNGLLRDRTEHKSSIYEPSPLEGLFHDFVESKILASAEKLEEELRAKRYYDVHLRGVKSPAITMRLKHYLTGSTGKKLNVHIESSRKSSEVDVCISGDISYEELKNRMDSITGKYGLKYSLGVKQGCIF